MKNKLVFSIIWTYLFAVCSCVLLIRFVCPLSSSSPPELSPSLGLACAAGRTGGQHLMGAGGSQLLASSSAPSDPLLQRRCSGGCPAGQADPEPPKFVVLPQAGGSARGGAGSISCCSWDMAGEPGKGTWVQEPCSAAPGWAETSPCHEALLKDGV